MFHNKNLLFIILLFIRSVNCDEDFKKYPYVVGVGFIETEQKTNRPVTETIACSGSVIEKNWVITAGSCTHKYSNREHFILSFDEYYDGYFSVRKVKVLSRELFTYAGSEEDMYGDVVAPTLLGLLKIETLPIKTLPELSSGNYTKHFGLPVVYVEYSAVRPKELKTHYLKIIDFVISPCPDVFKEFICVQDYVQSLATYYGAPLIHDNTVIGLYAGSSTTYATYKMFVPVSKFLNKVREKIAEENDPLVIAQLTMGLYS